MKPTNHTSSLNDNATIMGIRSSVIFWAVFVSVVLPSAWFIYISYSGLNEIISSLNSAYSKTTIPYLAQHSEQRDTIIIHDIVRAHIDFDTLSNRQARANSLLATRTWLRFMSSGFGSVLIFVGAVFLLSRIESLSKTAISAQNANSIFHLTTSSPGIIMVLIGALLMISPNFSEQTIEVRDPKPLLAAQSTVQVPDVTNRKSTIEFINKLANQ